MTIEKQVLFIHLEKTGGTSLIEMFRRLDGINLYHSQDLEQINVDDFSFLVGHWQADQFLHLLRDRFAFTFIRNPKDRTLSLYRFWKSHREEFVRADQENLYMCQLARDYSFQEFIRLPELSTKLDNSLVRTFCGDKQMQNIDKVSINEYEIALDNINRLDFVGIYENFEKSCEELFRLLKLPDLEILHENNLGRRVTNEPLVFEFTPNVVAEDLDIDTLKLLESATKYDDLLYASFSTIS